MTQFPGDPSTAVARIIKEHHKKITRIEARLDQGESNRSKDASDIATNTTDITANTTAITAVNGGTGGTAEENFLGKLAQAAVASSAGGDSAQASFLGNLGEMSHITDGSQSSTGGWTTGGALSGGPSQYWDGTHAAALVPWMNEVYSDIQNLYNLFGDLLTELQNSNYMDT